MSDIDETPEEDGGNDLVFENDMMDGDELESLGDENTPAVEDFDSMDAPDLERREDGDPNQLKRSIFSVPIEVTVTVGTARPLIGELLAMGRDHLLPLDSGIDDLVELRVKDRVIARGELTQTDEESGRLGIRLTEIVELTDLIQ